MYAARVQLVENVIKPALARGEWVVGDRHDMSSQAYQGGGRQIAPSTMQSLKQTALGDFKPDLTLYLDIDLSLVWNVLAAVVSWIALKNGHQLFERARERYLELANSDDSVVMIDAAQSIEQVTADIRRALQDWLSQVNRV